MKPWRLEVTTDNNLALVPTFDFFSNKYISTDIPDLVEIKELLLQGTKEADKKIRQMGIIISHDAIVWRREKKEAKK